MAQAFIAESRRVRYVQVTILVLSGFVLAVLLWQLVCVVSMGFRDHIGNAEEILMKVAERPRAAAAVEPSPMTSQKPPAKRSALTPPAAPVSPASASSESEVSEVKSLHELLASSVRAVTYSTVAVISILIIAISVITIAIAKVVFAMTPHRLTDDTKGASTDSEGSVKSDSAVVLPHLEFAKEFTKLFADLFKSQSR